MTVLLYPNRLPRAILTTLSAGPVKRNDLYAIVTAVAGNRHAAVAAIDRLAEKELVVCEVKLTRKGRRLLRSAA